MSHNNHFAHSADDEEGSEVSEVPEEDMTWIEWYCTMKGNEFFVEVEEEYIKDDFNLTGLGNAVRHYREALSVILDDSSEEDLEYSGYGKSDEWASASDLMLAAQSLYGLIHARYIMTSRGMIAMLEKYNSYLYGTCPNAFCLNQPVMPIGLSDNLGEGRTHVFCPRCNEVYYPRNARLAAVDGSFFGTSFPHLFFLVNSHLVSNTANIQYFVPKIHGFNLWRGIKDMLREERDKRQTDDRALTHG